jgi:hypothetical protein
VTAMHRLTPDGYNNIARTCLLSMPVTNSQGVGFANLAIILSSEVQGIRVSSNQFLVQGVSMPQSFNSLPVMDDTQSGYVA